MLCHQHCLSLQLLTIKLIFCNCLRKKMFSETAFSFFGQWSHNRACQWDINKQLIMCLQQSATCKQKPITLKANILRREVSVKLPLEIRSFKFWCSFNYLVCHTHHMTKPKRKHITPALQQTADNIEISLFVLLRWPETSEMGDWSPKC